MSRAQCPFLFYCCICDCSSSLSQSFNPLHMSLFQRCLFSEFFLSEVLSASLGEQIDGCARSAEIMVKKGDRRHIWYDVGIPCQI